MLMATELPAPYGSGAIDPPDRPGWEVHEEAADLAVMPAIHEIILDLEEAQIERIEAMRSLAGEAAEAAIDWEMECSYIDGAKRNLADSYGEPEIKCRHARTMRRHEIAAAKIVIRRLLDDCAGGRAHLKQNQAEAIKTLLGVREC